MEVVGGRMRAFSAGSQVGDLPQVYCIIKRGHHECRRITLLGVGVDNEVVGGNTHGDSLGPGHNRDGIRNICNTLHPTQIGSRLRGSERREGGRGAFLSCSARTLRVNISYARLLILRCRHPRNTTRQSGSPGTPRGCESASRLVSQRKPISWIPSRGNRICASGHYIYISKVGH